MRQLTTTLLFLGLMATSGLGEEGGTTSPPRLANGRPIEDTIQETNAEGLVFQTSKGLVMFPWKYLSAGTRYRHERTFLAAQEIACSNALQKTKSAVKNPAKTITDAKTVSAKAAVTNLPSPAVIK